MPEPFSTPVSVVIAHKKMSICKTVFVVVIVAVEMRGTALALVKRLFSIKGKDEE